MLTVRFTLQQSNILHLEICGSAVSAQFVGAEDNFTHFLSDLLAVVQTEASGWLL